uniref:Uncharacterized protein n=1 Tax=Podarcis muralis TaxID=64176 RepID=A0A670KMB6_PODMU
YFFFNDGRLARQNFFDACPGPGLIFLSFFLSTSLPAPLSPPRLPAPPLSPAFPQQMDFCHCGSAEGVRSFRVHQAGKSRTS